MNETKTVYWVMYCEVTYVKGGGMVKKHDQRMFEDLDSLADFMQYMNTFGFNTMIYDIQREEVDV